MSQKQIFANKKKSEKKKNPSEKSFIHRNKFLSEFPVFVTEEEYILSKKMFLSQNVFLPNPNVSVREKKTSVTEAS